MSGIQLGLCPYTSVVPIKTKNAGSIERIVIDPQKSVRYYHHPESNIDDPLAKSCDVSIDYTIRQSLRQSMTSNIQAERRSPTCLSSVAVTIVVRKIASLLRIWQTQAAAEPARMHCRRSMNPSLQISNFSTM